jgi:hypothetical protein
MSGAIMTAQLRGLHTEHWTGLVKGGRTLMGQGIQDIAALPAAQHEIVIKAYRHAISTTFLVGAVITTLAFVLVLFLPEHPLKSRRTGSSGTPAESPH